MALNVGNRKSGLSLNHPAARDLGDAGSRAMCLIFRYIFGRSNLLKNLF